MLAKRAISVALLAVVATANASDWKVIGDSGGGTVFLDRASIVRSKGITKVWMRQTFTPPKYIPEFSRPVAEKMQRWAIKCATAQTAEGAVSVLDISGGVIYSNSGSAATFADVAPDSLGEAVMKLVCP